MQKKTDVRTWLVEKFNSSFDEHSDFHNNISILVLGGGTNEPELEKFTGGTNSITYYGIETPGGSANYKYFDLDVPNKKTDKFDLVICNQVLEHLHNLGNAFAAIENLVKDDGLLWITVPASNFRHGSPNFYAAGYSREFLMKNLVQRNFKILELAELSSKRAYLYRHLLRIWPTKFQLNHPLIAYFGIPGSPLNKLIFNITLLPNRILLACSSAIWKIDDEFSIETFGLFRKAKSS